jgi:predicted methyltransferase
MPEIFYHSSLWKPTLDEVMRQHIKPGHKVAVVGTDVDDTTLLMAQLVGPKGKVYSFEGENLLDKNVVV